MKKVIYLLQLVTSIAFGQYSEVELLEAKKENFQRIVRAYEDSLVDVRNQMDKLKKTSFENSLKKGELIVYSNIDAPLRSGPSNFDSKLKLLPGDTQLRVIGKTGIYLRVECEYGIGYVSQNLTKEKASASSISKNKSDYTPPIKSNYSSSTTRKTKSSSNNRASRSYRSKTYRSYIRGPRGGCYYINSNGNKTYVARNLCN